ncbi:venom protease [Acyrthosiphon pisum]|uniref:Peptidase S1 domain-containing protein n=1 Tax=Acyrthosiphon pisum TaxID=7029 RepID=A0A8R2NLB4_ACYPI|nr:venom protease [Acyrthosiphon pisum]
MLVLKNFNVYLLPLCILIVFDIHATAGQLVRTRYEKNKKQGDQVCRQNTECVSRLECDIHLETQNQQKCKLGNELPMGFCCPVNKIIRLNTEKRLTYEDEESDLDKILDILAPELIKPLHEEPECGQNTKSLSNTSNVQNAKANDWPWMAVFLETTNYMNFCGGVLLNRQFVLTAAHCFIIYNKENVVVRLGEYDFTTDNETQYIDYRVTSIKLHPDYDHATHANDIAIVRLNKPTIYNSFIRPICLPKTNMEVYNRNAVVAGWGQTVYGSQVSNVLQEVTIPIWEHNQCVSAFSQLISKTNLCAASYEGGKDSCKGDSGGPLLVQRHDGKWTNVGVVSWGISCGEVGYPGVYTKVTSYLKWIAMNAQDVI